MKKTQIELLQIGMKKDSWLTECSSVFTQKLKPYCDFDWTHFNSPKHSSDQLEVKKKLESQILMDALSKRKAKNVFLLDEKAKLRTSIELTVLLEPYFERREKLYFVIGGAFGFSKELKNMYPQKISLSSLTLSHQVASVVFLEQLYRVLNIYNKTPYHHS